MTTDEIKARLAEAILADEDEPDDFVQFRRECPACGDAATVLGFFPDDHGPSHRGGKANAARIAIRDAWTGTALENIATGCGGCQFVCVATYWSHVRPRGTGGSSDLEWSRREQFVWTSAISVSEL